MELYIIIINIPFPIFISNNYIIYIYGGRRSFSMASNFATDTAVCHLEFFDVRCLHHKDTRHIQPRVDEMHLPRRNNVGWHSVQVVSLDRFKMIQDDSRLSPFFPQWRLKPTKIQHPKQHRSMRNHPWAFGCRMLFEICQATRRSQQVPSFTALSCMMSFTQLGLLKQLGRLGI